MLAIVCVQRQGPDLGPIRVPFIIFLNTLLHSGGHLDAFVEHSYS